MSGWRAHVDPSLRFLSPAWAAIAASEGAPREATSPGGAGVVTVVPAPCSDPIFSGAWGQRETKSSINNPARVSHIPAAQAAVPKVRKYLSPDCRWRLVWLL